PVSVEMPWPVECVSYHNGTLFASSRRQLSFNAVFANFLNRSALVSLGTHVLSRSQEMMDWIQIVIRNAAVSNSGKTTEEQSSEYGELHLRDLKPYGSSTLSSSQFSYGTYKSDDGASIYFGSPSSGYANN